MPPAGAAAKTASDSVVLLPRAAARDRRVTGVARCRTACDWRYTDAHPDRRVDRIVAVGLVWVGL